MRMDKHRTRVVARQVRVCYGMYRSMLADRVTRLCAKGLGDLEGESDSRCSYNH